MHRGALAAAVALLALAAPGRAAAQASSPIDFVPLDSTGNLRDCGSATGPAAARICRMRRPWTADQLRAARPGGEAVLRHGDELTFVHQGQAEEVELTGGVQGPMSRLRGTNLWVLTVRVPELDRAVIGYATLPLVQGALPAGRITLSHWRGPLAPPPAPAAAALRGRIVSDSIASRFLGETRGLTVYIPPARDGEGLAGVVYLGDGSSVRGLAPVVDTLVTTGRLPRILLVGMHSAQVRPGTPPDQDGRALEYLLRTEGANTRFLTHERFVLEEVLPRAEAAWGAPRGRDRRAVSGFSNSGALAMELGLRHPEVFGHVIALSPAGRRAAVLPGTRLEGAARYYLLGGTLEPSFHAKALDWARVLAGAGVVHTVREPVAGHDWPMWQSFFPDALAWAFLPAGGAAPGAR